MTKLVMLLAFLTYFQNGMDGSTVPCVLGVVQLILLQPLKHVDFHRHCGESESLRAVGKQSCMHGT